MGNLTRAVSAWLAGLLAVLVTIPAFGTTPVVVTRMVVPGGSENTAKIAPGGTVTFQVRIDAPTVATVGAAYRLTQTTGALNGYFSITGRSQAGSPFSDPLGGATDAEVIAAPGNIFDPDSDVNLGNSVLILSDPPADPTPVPSGNDILVTTVTLKASPSTPYGIYRIQPTPGVSFVTETTTNPEGNDVSMSDAYFDVEIAGVSKTLTVTVSNKGPNEVTAAAVNDPAQSGLTLGNWTCAVTTPGDPGSVTTACGAESGWGPIDTTVTLQVNGVVTFTIAATVTEPGGTVTNTASVTPPPGIANAGTSCTSSGGVTRSFNPATGACTTIQTVTVP